MMISKDMRPISDPKTKSRAEQAALVTALRESEHDFEEGLVITHEEMRAKWLTEAS